MRIGALAAVFVSALALLVPTACGSDGAGAAAAGEGGAPDPGSEGGAGGEGGGPATADGGRDGASGSDGASPDGSTVAPTCTGKTGLVGDRTVSLMVGGTARSFDLHVPPSYDATKGAPLVLLFHGFTMTASSIATATHFAATADARGMIVAFPTGVGQETSQGSFNAGDCCGPAQATNVDDVAFTRAMIASLEGDYCVNPKRVFAAGFSNGGFLAYYLACNLADQIAAIGAVSGGLRVDAAACDPKRPVPVLHIHGTNDALVPFAGGSGAQPVSFSIDTFKTKNGCAAGAGTVVYTKGAPSSLVSCTKWGGCTAGADVELCTVTGGGHQWPGGDLLPYGLALSTDINASDTLADFFQSHPMP